MVPKIMPYGQSFVGANAYYSRDKDADTSERVDWVETRNLATDDPDLAARIMAATAMCQERLKANAGVPPTGRKSNGPVMTYTLGWHPDEKKHLTKEEMIVAADETLALLGADNRQAVIYAHNDTDHPHIHIMINRVSTEDGRMLSSSLQRLKFSRWAQHYEEQRGRIFCEQRVKNNHARDVLKQFTRASKDRPRHIVELEASAKTSILRRPEEAKALRQSEKEKDLALAQKGREMQERHSNQWDQLAADHKQRKKDISAWVKREQKSTRAAIVKRDKPVKLGLDKRHSAEQRLFERREKRLSGRVRNIVERIRDRDHQNDKRQSLMGRAFKMIASKQARLDDLNKRQAREVRTFKTAQNKEIKQQSDHIKQAGVKKKEDNLSRYYRDRKDIAFQQSMDNAKLKAGWKQRNVDRKAAWKEFRVGSFLKKYGVDAGSATRRRNRGIEMER